MQGEVKVTSASGPGQHPATFQGWQEGAEIWRRTKSFEGSYLENLFLNLFTCLTQPFIPFSDLDIYVPSSIVTPTSTLLVIRLDPFQIITLFYESRTLNRELSLQPLL